MKVKTNLKAGGVHMPSFHYIVPEPEFTTHYFAMIARDVKIDDPAEDERMIDYVMRAFTEEDEPMIRACQELMGTADLFSLKAAILKTDAPAVQARRMIAKLLGQEESALTLAAE